jgi:hypothetical protein
MRLETIKKLKYLFKLSNKILKCKHIFFISLRSFQRYLNCFVVCNCMITFYTLSVLLTYILCLSFCVMVLRTFLHTDVLSLKMAVKLKHVGLYISHEESVPY